MPSTRPPMLPTPDALFLDVQEALAGQYFIERELGRGGMGVVYLAREVRLDRLVALKVLPPALAGQPALRERFLREARTAAKLSHPNIVPIYQVGEAGAFVYFAMAYVNGETLGERIRRRGALPPVEAARVLREVAWALAYAHQTGVVHRDVKPDNILIEASTARAVVMDFGIASAGATDHAPAGSPAPTPITAQHELLGTAHYMSPEQAAGEAADGRSDLYSLGIVGFAALTGRLPFDAPTTPAVLALQLTRDAPPVGSVNPGVPARLAQAVDRCLRKDPAERFASGEALAEALEPGAGAASELPVPLRAWVQAQNPLRAYYVMWSGLFALGTFANLARGGGRPDITGTLAVLPAVPLVGFHLRQAYRVLRAGYGIADMRLTLRRWQAERREEVAYESRGSLSAPLQALRTATYLSTAAFGTLLTHSFFGFDPVAVFGREGAQFIAGATAASMFGTVAASNALGVPLLGRRFKRATVGALRAAFWNSRVGEWAARHLTSERPSTVTQLLDRPTEAAIGLAAGDLFAALPKPLRREMSELPAVVARLERHAAEIRAHVAALTDSIAGVGASPAGVLAAERRQTHAELSAARDASQARLAEAVAALETIRLNLLRLHAGADNRPAALLTEALAAAQRLASDLGARADAAAEVERLAGSPRERPSLLAPLRKSPTPA